MSADSTTTANLLLPGTFVPYERQLSADSEVAMSEGSLFFEDKGKVQESLRRITRRLDELEIPYAVAGGMAVFHHGYRRFTEDIDILVNRNGLKRLHEALEGRGFVRPFSASKNLRDAQTGVKIEFLITGDYPGDGKPKDPAFPEPADVSVRINEMSFLNLAALVNLKLASGLTGQMRGKDLIDVAEIIRALHLPESLANSLSATTRETYLDLWRQVESSRPVYVKLIDLPNDATVIDWQSLRLALPNMSEELARLEKAGVELDCSGKIVTRRIVLHTRISQLAEEFGLFPLDEMNLD